MSNNTKLLCLFLRAQKINKSSEQGYAMAMVSMVSIIMLSLLAASMTFSNLAKTRTDAFVDTSSAFSVAESGLNKRAIDLQTKLTTYSGLRRINNPLANLSSCFGVAIPAGQRESTSSGTNDFECRNYSFESSNNLSKVASGRDIVLNSNEQDKNTYVAYTFVADKTIYGADGISPRYTNILTGEPFAGLNAAEYNYEVQSTAKKPVVADSVSLPNYTTDEIAALNRQTSEIAAQPGDDVLIASANTKMNLSAAGKSSTNTNLSVNFLTRVIPLFQFGIFYDGDMELNSTSPMQLQGRVHSNANIYVQPAGIGGADNNKAITTFLSNVSTVGSMYNRVDAWDTGTVATGITRVLLTGDSCATTVTAPDNCRDITPYVSTFDTPIVLSSITAPSTARVNLFPDNKVLDGLSGAVSLKTPEPGFTRKRNYANNKIGIYYSQADMRLEMVPDRDLDLTTTAATAAAAAAPAAPTAAATAAALSDRNQRIIPFNFTAIRTGGSGTCTTALPTAGSDPATNYIDPTRENASTRRCNVFTKGQLQSLRQPVMVLTSINQNNSNSTFNNTQWRAWEGTVLGAPTDLSTIVRPALSAGNDNLATKRKIIRALQVALASTPTPVRFERLDIAIASFSNLAYASESLIDFQTGFSNLLNQITELTGADRFNLLAASPKQVAALVDAWFLPAPIQRVTRPIQDTDPTEAARNPRQSGFYDGRERRWITMLQTNIASLSVWNRDGLYVDSTDSSNLLSAYAPTATGQVDAFNEGAGANFTDGMAFDRSAADATKPISSLQYMGLGSSDTTEGGLVLHATVSDDLNGNGGALSATEDITVDKTDTTQRVLKKKADNTNEQADPSCNPLTTNCAPIVIDYYRKYPGQTASKQSPFGFAFNGGDYLPGALLLSSDQSVYIQGNFNNHAAAQVADDRNVPSPDRLPASVIADTITALSNECVSLVGAGDNDLGVPAGQLKCGVPLTVNTNNNNSYDAVLSPMAINAAFLSNTPISNGNKGTGRYDGGTKSYSGGVNNYIRLLEDWNNNEDLTTNKPIPLNYSGSLISLGAPLEYSGQYVAGGADPAEFPYYNVPFRNINFDPYFTRIERLPPLTPKATYVKQKNFSRSY
jgi:Tfp pilus assembly protein PilX